MSCIEGRFEDNIEEFVANAVSFRVRQGVGGIEDISKILKVEISKPGLKNTWPCSSRNS